MTKIQELANRIKGIVDGLVSPRTQTMLYSWMRVLDGALIPIIYVLTMITISILMQWP